MLFFNSYITGRGKRERKPADHIANIGEEPTGTKHALYERATFIASESRYITSNDTISLDYTVFRSKSDLLLDLYVSDMKEHHFMYRYKSVDPSVWGAEAVYTEQNRKAIVVFKDVVFIYTISDEYQFDSSDISNIKKALGV